MRREKPFDGLAIPEEILSNSEPNNISHRSEVNIPTDTNRETQSNAIASDDTSIHINKDRSVHRSKSGDVEKPGATHASNDRNNKEASLDDSKVKHSTQDIIDNITEM